MTYRALVAAADRAAAVLAGEGVAAGDVVVVRAERTPETMTVLLGLLKVGAVYACAPVDWPVGRCRQLVQQTGATVCVTSVPGEPVGTTTTLTVEDVLAIHPDRPLPATRPTPPTDGGRSLRLPSRPAAPARPRLCSRRTGASPARPSTSDACTTSR